MSSLIIVVNTTGLRWQYHKSGRTNGKHHEKGHNSIKKRICFQFVGGLENLPFAFNDDDDYVEPPIPLPSPPPPSRRRLLPSRKNQTTDVTIFQANNFHNNHTALLLMMLLFHPIYLYMCAWQLALKIIQNLSNHKK